MSYSGFLDPLKFQEWWQNLDVKQKIKCTEIAIDIRKDLDFRRENPDSFFEEQTNREFDNLLLWFRAMAETNAKAGKEIG